MSRLEKILKTLDTIADVLTLITHIDDSVKEAYGGETTQTSPELLNRLEACFQRIEQIIGDKDFMTNIKELEDNVSIYLLDECRNEKMLVELLKSKAGKILFVPDYNYGYFFDFCRAADNENVAIMVSLLLDTMNDLNKEPLPANEESQLDNNTSIAMFDPDYLMRIYLFCTESKVFNVTLDDFKRAVSQADFNSIIKMDSTLKGKLKYLIYILGCHADTPDWYINAAHSIDTEPNKCSGATAPTAWKKQAKAIK